MGLDLTIIVERWSKSNSVLGYDRLGFERQRDLFDRIRAMESAPLNGVLADYTDDGLRETTTDAYGEPLRFLRPGSFLLVLQDAERAGEELTPWNRAVFAFLTALPPDMRCVLYWN